MLYTVNFKHFTEMYTFENTFIIDSDLDIENEEPEIIYKIIHTSPDDIYDSNECEITVNHSEIRKFTEKDRREIIEEILRETADGIIETLEIDVATDEPAKIDAWLKNLKEISVDELRDLSGIASRYEEYKVESTPPNELPLLMNTLKTTEGKRKLEQILGE